MVHIIGFQFSTCVQRVLTTLAEKGITDYTMYTPDMMGKQEHKKKPHTDKQPFGAIPVLEDGDFTLFESRAMCRYIAEKYADQGTKLTPARGDLKAQALFDQWASVETFNWETYAVQIVTQKLFNKLRGLEPVPEILDAATTAFNAKLDVFETILAKQKYMAGDEFSVIDIYYLPHTQKLFEIGEGELITSRPNVNAWWESVSTRESWKKVYAPFPS